MPRSPVREVVLLLPGMTLNASIFPSFPIDMVAVDFVALPELVRDGMLGYVRRLREALDKNGFWEHDRRYVVAHSFGGMLALSWLVHHAQDRSGIDGMILVGTTAGPMLDRARLRLFGLGTWAVRVPIRPLLAFWDMPGVTKAMKLFTTRTLSPDPVDFRKLRFTSDLAVDLAGWRNTHWQAMRSFRNAMRGFDVRDRLPDVTTPTVVLHGPRDSLFDLGVARELADGLPNAELRVVEGAAHLLPLTHGDQVVRALEGLRRR